MTDADSRVAVYIDFDNIVISRFDQVHGKNAFHRDKPRGGADLDDAFADKLDRAEVDLGAILDFASSYGTLVLTRAYADWSSAVNARYKDQLVGRAVDLVQLFPAAAYGKNGADIRLAVDAVEDLFRLPDLTTIVIVAGDSDYIALAQRCKRLGRYVVAIGVAGSTSRSLAAACDELVIYDALPGISNEPEREADERARSRATTAVANVLDGALPNGAGVGGAASESAAGDGGDGSDGTGADAAGARPDADDSAGDDATAPPKRSRRATRRTAPADADADDAEPDPQALQQAATRLLDRALRLGHEKEDADWLHNSAVKSQMRRMDPSFSEKALGYRSFSDFLRSRSEVVDLDESSTARMVRLKPTD